MKSEKFDSLTCSFAGRASRRGFIRVVSAGAAGLVGGALGRRTRTQANHQFAPTIPCQPGPAGDAFCTDQISPLFGSTECVPSARCAAPFGLQPHCEFVFRNPGTPCFDGNACTGPDFCDPRGHCISGPPINCDDGDACTVDSCNSDTGCTHVAAVCDDGNPCTENTCDPSTGCVFTDKSCEQFEDQCNAGICNPLTGACEAVPVPGQACDDGEACTFADFCDANGVCQPGTALDCSHLDGPCSTGRCDNGVCVSDPIHVGQPCDDGNVCNGISTCSATGVCAPGTPLVCAEDSNPCTVAACDPSNGCFQQSVPNGTACGNGICSAGVCLTCKNNEEVCNGMCRAKGSYNQDDRNCGACGHVCPSTHLCKGGFCRPI